MPLTNTTETYGGIAKTFHWLTALLILTAIPLGAVANDMPYDSAEALALKATVFSIHKTVGLAAFAVALARILWAFVQSKPRGLAGHGRAEAALAATVHWLLYGSLVVVPLTGWIHHAATTGFAPIWWPLSQDLPFVPKDDGVAAVFAGLHLVTKWVLIAAIALHVAGALKHHLIDRDATLRRMLPGHTAAAVRGHGHGFAPLVVALILWTGAIGAGGALGAYDKHAQVIPGVTLSEVASDWTVTEGSLTIAVTQLGAQVEGSFADWTADITYEPRDTQGPAGRVEVTVAIPSLTLGSVTAQALGVDFFEAVSFPTATFTADILRIEGGHIAEGTLTIRDRTVPVTLPFELALSGDIATMTGGLTVNRLDFGIGAATQPNDQNVGFAVEIDVTLSATRATE